MWWERCHSTRKNISPTKMISIILIIYFTVAFISFSILMALIKKEDKETIRDLEITSDEYYEQKYRSSQVFDVLLASSLWFVIVPYYIFILIVEGKR
jgi:magnesium-transporting ATPase (P-type)